MDDNVLTQQDIEYITAMYAQWELYKTRNYNLSCRYDGDVTVKDLGISVPPAQVAKLRKCSLMWSHLAVKNIADTSNFEGYIFTNGTPKEFLEAVEINSLVNKYDETLPSQLQHGCSFITTTAGGKNEPAVIHSTYDALHATALWDYRRNRVLCGLAIVDVDPTDPEKITAFNYYAPNGDIVEFETLERKWIWRRLKSFTGRCALEVMRNEPDKRHPFGQTVITNAIRSLEDEANRELVRMIIHSEFFTSPPRWITGAPEDIFENGKWEAYIGSFLALPSIDEEGNNLPQTGQYQQQPMQPHIQYIRQLAALFSSEASIPMHTLLYTDANPASAEAMEASRTQLVERVRKLNRLNGDSLKNVGLLTLSILKQTPVDELTMEDRDFEASFRNPAMNSLSATADAAYKIAVAEPNFVHLPQFWNMLGYNARQIKDIMNNLECVNDLGVDTNE